MNTIEYNQALAVIDMLAKQAHTLDREQQMHLADALQRLYLAMFK